MIDRACQALNSRKTHAPLLLALAAEACAMTSYYLLYPSLPLFAAKLGFANAGAGLMTGILMLATVLVEPAAPRLARRFGYRSLVLAGVLLLGLPPLVLIAEPSFALAAVICAVRGVGLALVLVGVSALIALLVPAERRSQSFGLFGVASSLPSFFALPLGLWLAGRGDFLPIFIVGAAAVVAGAACVARLPDLREADAPTVTLGGVLSNATLTFPIAGMFFAALAAGAVTTFLPMIAAGVTGAMLGAALFANAVAMTAGRWLGGRLGVRWGQGRLLTFAVLLLMLALAILAALRHSDLVVGPMIAVGIAFGLVQNASFSVMLERSEGSPVGPISAVWNIAYDAGIGAGAFGFGIASTQYGCLTAMVAGICAISLVLLFCKVIGHAAPTAAGGAVCVAA